MSDICCASLFNISVCFRSQRSMSCLWKRSEKSIRSARKGESTSNQVLLPLLPKVPYLKHFKRKDNKNPQVNKCHWQPSTECWGCVNGGPNPQRGQGVTFTEFIPAAGSQLCLRVNRRQESGSCTSTFRSLAVCFRLQCNQRWCTINSCHQQHSGSHGWQHHQALLQWRHLPDHHGGAGGHVQAHPYWNLTGDQQVTQTRGEDWRFTRRLWTQSEL